MKNIQTYSNLNRELSVIIEEMVDRFSTNEIVSDITPKYLSHPTQKSVLFWEAHFRDNNKKAIECLYNLKDENIKLIRITTKKDPLFIEVVYK